VRKFAGGQRVTDRANSLVAGEGIHGAPLGAAAAARQPKVRAPPASRTILPIILEPWVVTRLPNGGAAPRSSYTNFSPAVVSLEVVMARDVFLLGAGAMVAWSAIRLLHAFVLVTEAYVRMGLY